MSYHAHYCEAYGVCVCNNDLQQQVEKAVKYMDAAKQSELFNGIKVVSASWLPPCTALVATPVRPALTVADAMSAMEKMAKAVRENPDHFVTIKNIGREH